MNVLNADGYTQHGVGLYAKSADVKRCIDLLADADLDLVSGRDWHLPSRHEAPGKEAPKRNGNET